VTVASAPLDAVLALAIVGVAAAWLAARAVRAVRGRGAGCACPASTSERGCSRASKPSDAARAAARRALSRR
jgi:hypothetical protein